MQSSSFNRAKVKIVRMVEVTSYRCAATASIGCVFWLYFTLVIALYLRSENVMSLYAQPLAIWLLIPILLFWVSWVWLKSSRGEMRDDPIVFAAKIRQVYQ